MIRALYNSKEYRKNEDNKYLHRYSVFRKIRRRYTMPKLFEVYPVAKVGNMMLVWPWWYTKYGMYEVKNKSEQTKHFNSSSTTAYYGTF